MTGHELGVTKASSFTGERIARDLAMERRSRVTEVLARGAAVVLGAEKG
jgi:hypothetical protein